MVHHQSGSNKLNNEKSYERLTGRERSVLAGDRAMGIRLFAATESRGRGIQREIIAGDGDRELMLRFGGELFYKIVVFCCTKRKIIKEV